MMPRRGRTRTEARWLIGLLRDIDDDDDDHNLQSAERLIWDVFELCGSKMLILIMMTMMMMVWTVMMMMMMQVKQKYQDNYIDSNRNIAVDSGSMVPHKNIEICAIFPSILSWQLFTTLLCQLSREVALQKKL